MKPLPFFFQLQTPHSNCAQYREHRTTQTSIKDGSTGHSPIAPFEHNKQGVKPINNQQQSDS